MSSPTSQNMRKCNLPEDSIARHIADYWAKVEETASDPTVRTMAPSDYLYAVPAWMVDKDGRIKGYRV